MWNGFDTGVPFGGYKMSGIGREKGEAALDHYTQASAHQMYKDIVFQSSSQLLVCNSSANQASNRCTPKFCVLRNVYSSLIQWLRP